MQQIKTQLFRNDRAKFKHICRNLKVEIPYELKSKNIARGSSPKFASNIKQINKLPFPLKLPEKL